MREINLTSEANYDALDWLPENTPYVEVDPKTIKIIETPKEFYEKLLCLIREAKERIVISALYLGNGSYEEALVDELEKALDRNPNLKISILFDCLRCTRGGAESGSILLLKRLAHRASVYLFHTPSLRGLKKMVLPEKVNEVIGLQHMKLLVFDSHIIFTGIWKRPKKFCGEENSRLSTVEEITLHQHENSIVMMVTSANLSSIYFTNRLDRYILIENCLQLANFVDSLVEAIGSCSFILNMQGTISLAKDAIFILLKSMLHSRVAITLNAFSKESDSKGNSATGTRIYPLLQMGIISINQEFEFLKNLLSLQNHELSLTLSSGYFNFTDSYTDLVANQNCFEMDIVYGSPQANGFYQASGLFGFIPLMYVYISHLFYKIIGRNIHLFEYNKPGWSYHVKGLWINSKQLPYIATMIGSSNFGHRSVHRDLEAQFFIITCNEKLKLSLQEERSRILNYATKVDAEIFSRYDHFSCFDGIIGTKGASPAASSLHLSRRNRTQRRSMMYHGFKHTKNVYETRELLQRLERCSSRHLTSRTTSAPSSNSLDELLKDEIWKEVLNLSMFNAELLDQERATILFGDISGFSSSLKEK
ncbi:CDP-diacylglycerol--glycerol-3-phosphate 3-phosphatidyltransferase, mitochondrial [Dirofilaria immitis]|nr:CDP-diacylglycerol--glycerol-3-phosphate 3-phosphatidyltransferase, mitochondrial [Dirofilaria immitis]